MGMFEKQIAKFEQLVRSGHTPKMIASALGVPYESLKIRIKETGMLHGRLITQVRKFVAEYERLREKGDSIRDIAVYFGVELKTPQAYRSWVGWINRLYTKTGFAPSQTPAYIYREAGREFGELKCDSLYPRKVREGWAYHANGTRYPMRHGEPDLIAWCFKRSG